MTTRKRKIAVASTTSALAALALAGTVSAQDSTDTANYGQSAESHQQATDARAHANSADRSEAVEEAREMASEFGVSELNDIENWKITNGGRELGEIDRIAIDRDSGELVAVVALAGVVGVNMKEVAIPLSELETAGDETLSTDMTEAELEQQRDIDPWDETYSSLEEEASELEEDADELEDAVQ